MKRKFTALLCSLVLLCVAFVSPFSALAAASSASGTFSVDAKCPTCGGALTYKWWSTLGAEVELKIINNAMVSIPSGSGSLGKLTERCESCGYEKTEWKCLGLQGGSSKPGEVQATKAPSGIGRKDLPGYADDNGTPDIYPTGSLVYMVEPYACAVHSDGIAGFYKNVDDSSFAIYSMGGSGSGTKYGNVSWTGATYKFVAPVSGLYFIGSDVGIYEFGHISFFDSSSSDWIGYNLKIRPSKKYLYSITLTKGDTCYFSFSYYKSDYFVPSRGAYKYQLSSIPIFVEPLGDSSVTTVNNITITNNNYSQTWNGNIYTDSSTNLTYIYPEYTTINENNETVTNISNNPIIYNNETQQYYTYDSTTNNYYYITYGDTPATPTPSPSPEPTPTPAPGADPTPTPTPGGGSGGGDSGSGSGSSGSSWWEKLLDKLGSAIVDGLLGAISAVLKLIFKLLSTILGWIIWLVSQVLTLFPFLPPGLGTLLIGGVVVCFVIGIIKFIRG